MISDQLSAVLRSVMVIAGILGFLVGAGSVLGPTISSGFSMSGTLGALPEALFRGTLLCVGIGFCVRFVLLNVFRDYIRQLVIKKQTPDPVDKTAKK